MKIATALAALVSFVAASSITVAADRAWEIRGELEAITSGTPQIAVLRLIDGRRIEVPVDALSPTSQAAVRAEAATPPVTGDGGVGVRAAGGRNGRLAVPEIIKDVEADAQRCRDATQASEVYRLFLAGDRLAPEQRSAAEARARVWSDMSQQGMVRLGDRWVSPGDAQAAHDEARRILAHALELMRLGNADLAEDELRKASRLDPTSGRAGFVAGLAYARVANKPDKAVEHLASVVDREPGNAPALNDLAVLEVLTRRHAAVARHFRRAIENAVDPMPVVENIAWALKLSGAAKLDPSQARYRMPDKTIEDLNVLYRVLTQQLKLKPWDDVAEPRYLGPDGAPCTATTLADVAALFEGSDEEAGEARITLGFAVAPGHVVCPRGAVTRADGSVFPEVRVESPEDRAQWLSATVVSAPEDADVALLQCDELAVKPLPLAATTAIDSTIMAIDRSGDSWLDVRLTAAPGAIVTSGGRSADHGRFVHTAVVPRGPGGGPIVDAAGLVVGMVASTPRTDASGNVTGFGIPVDHIRSLTTEIASAVDAVAARVDKGLPEAAAAAVESTVLIVATTSQPQAAPAEPQAPP